MSVGKRNDPTPGNGGAHVWGWANSDEAESYTGAHATREEAIADAIKSSEPEQAIWIIEGRYPMPSQLIGSGVVDRMLEDASDNAEVGEYDGEILSVTEESSNALLKTIWEWADRNIQVNAWGAASGASSGAPARHRWPSDARHLARSDAGGARGRDSGEARRWRAAPRQSPEPDAHAEPGHPGRALVLGEPRRGPVDVCVGEGAHRRRAGGHLRGPAPAAPRNGPNQDRRHADRGGVHQAARAPTKGDAVNPRRRRRLRFQRGRQPCLRCQCAGSYFAVPWYGAPPTRIRCGVCRGMGALRPSAATNVHQNYALLFAAREGSPFLERLRSRYPNPRSFRAPMIPRSVWEPT